MKLYNTLSQKIETVQPQNPPEITVYTCGPTVYDYPHVGNWFTFIRYDLLIRALTAAGFKVKWVMNITDVGHLVSDADEGEDKLEKGAKREGKTAWQIAAFYSDYFINALKPLNITSPNYLVKATDHIADQIELINKLEAKGYTYVIDDGVYFDTSKFSRYADFGRLDLDEQQSGGRVALNPQKHQPTDFALWKFSPKNQKRDMEWDSPWGKGFPGWHIECSAMSMKYLGDTIDIHAGGIDHLPVHHTNEIAQSESVSGKPLAKFWMHTNHVTAEGEKIAKSGGNAITLDDIKAKGFTLAGFRLHILESHYRSQSKFSWASLEAAQNRLNSLTTMADFAWQPKAKAKTAVDFEKIYDGLQQSMENDLDSPNALKILSDIQNKLEVSLLGPEDVPAFKRFLEETEKLLGLSLANRPDINADQKRLIEERQLARRKENWSKSDEIRDQLLIQGIGLRDTILDSVWYRTQ
ncbi:MAG: cysteine--tRNA ligase [Candidatus Saccharimonadales bacterium]